MDTFRIVHATNLRLDRPFEGLPSPPQTVVQALRDASLRSWEALVRLTIDCDAAALLLAGRLYEGAVRGRRAQVCFRQGLERLSVRGVPVFISLDEEEAGAWDMIQEWPPGVTVFASPAVRGAVLARSGHHLATVHGCGGAGPDLAARLEESVRGARGTDLQIALLSGEPPSAVLPREAGSPRAHEATSTCPQPPAKGPIAGVGYWALASRLDWAVLHRDPWVVTPGTTQGRSFAAAEQGRKGAAIVDIGAGGVTGVSFAPLDRVRLLRLDVEAPAGTTLAALEAALQQRADEASAEHAGVSLLLAARVTGDALAGVGGDARRAELLERLRARSLQQHPPAWWATIEAVPDSNQPHPSNATRVPPASMVLEQSDAFLGAALPRSSFLARCFQPLMNVCDAEIGLGEIRELVRESAALAIDRLAEDESAEDPRQPRAAQVSESCPDPPAGLTVVQIGAAERKASVLASMQRTLFGRVNSGSSRLEGDRDSGLVVSVAGRRLTLAGAANGEASSGAARCDGAASEPTEVRSPRPEANDDVFRAVFLLDAKSVRSSTPALAAALASRPSTSIATRMQRRIEHALEALEGEARNLLGGGTGRIDRIIAARNVIDERLRAAREAEVRCVALLGREVPRTLEVVRAREALADRRTEREILLHLLRIWPLWQERQELLAAIAAITPIDPEQLARYDALQEKVSAARAAGRALRWRCDHLRIEYEGLNPDQRLLAVSARARRLVEQVSTYRDDLIVLAARRARCQEVDTALTKGLEKLSPPCDLQGLTAFDPDALDLESLEHWSRRFTEAVARTAAAAAAEQEARDRADSLSKEIAQRLDEPPASDEGDLDGEWRCLWRLRTALDELWVVQSEAEAKARAVREREETLRKLESRSQGASGATRVWLGVAVGLALGALLTFGALGQFVRATYAAFGAVGLLLVDFALGVRRRAVAARQGRREIDGAKVRREIERARLERDAAWLRAGDLQALVSANAEVLGLASMPPIETVDAREQILAQQATAARESGVGEESLSARMVDLLSQEERCRALAADREKALDEESSIRRGWETWRTEVGLPEGLAVLDARAWLAEVRRLRGVAAQLGEAGDELRRIEPKIAVWEGGVRFTLAQIGVNVANDLCGTRLVEEIRSLNARVSDAEGRALRRSQVESERKGVEERLAAAGEEIAATEAELAVVLSKLGATTHEDVERLRADLRNRDVMRSSVERCEQAIEVMLADARRSQVGDRRSTFEKRLRDALADGRADGWSERARQLETEIGEAERSLAHAIEQQDEETKAWLSLGEVTEVPDLELEGAGLAAELESAARRWRVLAVGRGLLEETARELERTQRRAVLVDASTILADLTGGLYSAITLDETGGGLALHGRAGRRVRLNGPVDADAAAHLGLSIRLAIARHVSQEALSCPLMVDDLLLAFGEREKEGVAAQLVAFARGQQVLYFTCDRSSWEHLSRLDAGARLIET